MTDRPTPPPKERTPDPVVGLYTVKDRVALVCLHGLLATQPRELTSDQLADAAHLAAQKFVERCYRPKPPRE